MFQLVHVDVQFSNGSWKEGIFQDQLPLVHLSLKHDVINVSDARTRLYETILPVRGSRSVKLVQKLVIGNGFKLL